MPDNVGYTAGIGTKIASREVSYSGETAQAQAVGLMTFSGGDDAKTAADVDASNPLPMYRRDPSTATSFGPITTANTVLFAAIDTADENVVQLQISGSFAGGVFLQSSMDNSTWFSCRALSINNDLSASDTVFAPDQFIVPVLARYFRAITTPDFVGSISGAYAQRSLDPKIQQIDAKLVELDSSVVLPIAGVTPAGHRRQLTVSDNGGIQPADGLLLTGTRNPASVGPILQFETTGYGSILLQLQGPFTGTVTFQVSNDGTTFQSALAWPVSGAASPVSSSTAVGQWVIPAMGRFFRAQMTTAGTGTPTAIAVLKNWSAWLPTNAPSIAANSSVNVSQIGASALAAEDSAATTVPMLVGGITRTALPASTIVAGDAIRATFSQSGQLITKQFAVSDLDFYVNATVTTNTQTALRAAQGANIRQNVTSVIFQNTSATATVLTIQDGSTTLATFSCAASMSNPVQLFFVTPLRGTANTALNYIAGTAAANVLLNVCGYNSY